MVLKYVLPLVAMGLMIFAGWSVFGKRANAPVKVLPPAPPPHSPYGHSVAGAGIVEARAENIAVGSPTSGVVVEVLVKVDQQVRAGDPLFRLDDRPEQADLKFRQAALAAAEAQVERLEHFPRPEEVPLKEAEVAAALATYEDQQDQLRRIRPLVEKGINTQNDLMTHQQGMLRARAMLEKAEADLALLKAGAWKYELAVSRAAVAQAQAQVEQVETDIERLTVRALSDGQVLQVSIRPGEWVGASYDRPLILLGDIERLHARVDIDEYDIPRFRPDAEARATVRGYAEEEFQLTFVRVEPYVIPKQNLTGRNTERVDTRVLQAIYKIEGRGHRLFVGQQLDVFIEAEPSEVLSRSQASAE